MTFHIHICGQVQGVGFRPFVYRLAEEMKLKGYVSNGNDGVHIELSAKREVALHFYDKILKNSPILAKITAHSFTEIPKKFFDNFEIRESDTKASPNLLLTPDTGLCEDCRKEIADKNNRRYAYAFTTCTNCGVRYSVIENLPYDRENTSMKKFVQCADCEAEYNNPSDRRYYSQTNSCQTCGVKMELNQPTLNSQDALAGILKAWTEGKIVAIKGIGGYLLTCDATNPLAIKTLRERKNRPTKPFALMYPDLATVEKDTELTETQKKLLKSPESPIVLLDTKRNMPSGIAKADIAPNLNQIGVILSYTPLFALLLHEFQKPIVATSGNISHSPIIFEDEKALKDLSKIADLIVTNNRQIIVPQDDSVIVTDQFDNQSIIIRRSRGFAPTFIQKDLILSENTVLATGAMMKSTFALNHQKNIYISQYLGDLESFETQENYKLVLNHFFKLFKTKPNKIITDKHPHYFSTQFGKELAEKEQVSTVEVQHHLAHFAAVLGENELLRSEKPILGVIWDGTGLGDDQNIWGGEFFSYRNQQFSRSSHFSYFPFILGDKMPKEPRISAFCASYGIENTEKIIGNKFTKIEWDIYQKLIEKHTLKTSSVGRLFDAVASLLGISDKATYEGEAAMYLENIAYNYLKKNKLENIILAKELANFSELPLFLANNQVSTPAILAIIIQDLQQKKPIDFIAAKLHYLLVEIIKSVAIKLNINKIAFSGGVFQNRLLVTLIKQRLSKEFDLYFHKQLSPNDENISFGQSVINSLQT